MAKRIGKKLKGKKASIQDLIFISAALLVFSIAVLLGFKISSEFDSRVQADSAMPTEAKTASTTLTGYYPSIMDNVFMLLLVGLCIVALILASLVRIHPVFIALFFIAWVFIIFLSGIMSNIFQEMASTPELITQANQLTFISQIMNTLPFIIGVFGVVLMIVMYKLFENG